MKTNRKRPARAVDLSVEKPARKRRVKRTPPSESPSPANGPYVKTDISPEELFRQIGRLRKAAEIEIERLLAFLDEIDGDSDMEPGLAAPERHIAPPYTGSGCHLGSALYFDKTGSQLAWASGGDSEQEGDGCADDREPDVDDEEDNPDEPNLGWTDEEAARGRVYAGAMGSCADLEEQCEDEPDVDGEPSLGWTIGGVIGNTSVDRVDVEGTSGEAVL